MNPLRSQNSLQQYKTRQNRENKTEKPFFFFFFCEAKKKYQSNVKEMSFQVGK